MRTTRTASGLTDRAFEAAFRAHFIERAKTIGTVKELPGDSGSKIQVTMGAGRRVWRLDPQVQLGSTMPDFMLEQVGGGARSIAIYTDGFRYHASLQHNRIADDAEKRSHLRDQGHLVLAVTARDLQVASSGRHEVPAPWFELAAAQKWSEPLGLSQKMLESVRMDPLTRLMAWMQDPTESETQWGAIARHLPLLTFAGSTTTKAHDSGDAQSIAVESLRDAAPSGDAAWLVRHGAMALASRRDGSKAHAALVLDDREATLTAPTFDDDWRAWLTASNVLGFHPDARGIRITALSQHLASDAPAPTPDVAEPSLPADWQQLLDGLADDEAAVLQELASLTGATPPAVGAELGDGIPVVFSWEDRRVAADSDLTDDDRAELTAAGWTVVRLDLAELRSALQLD